MLKSPINALSNLFGLQDTDYVNGAIAANIFDYLKPAATSGTTLPEVLASTANSTSETDSHIIIGCKITGTWNGVLILNLGKRAETIHDLVQMIAGAIQESNNNIVEIFLVYPDPQYVRQITQCCHRQIQ